MNDEILKKLYEDKKRPKLENDSKDKRKFQRIRTIVKDIRRQNKQKLK